MTEKEVLEILFAKDTSQALQRFRVLEFSCADSNHLYRYFDSYLHALQDKNSCVRARGFKLICHNAKWDSEGRINKNIHTILNALDDEKGTIVRQCLSVLSDIGFYKKELIPAIKKKLNQMDYFKHKESMQGLLKKDTQYVLSMLA